MLDLSILANIVLIGALLVAICHAWQEHTRAEQQMKRSDENWMWAELHRNEADAARERVRVLECRYATLQMLYAETTRHLLAHNYWLIDRNVRWRRQQKK